MSETLNLGGCWHVVVFFVAMRRDPQLVVLMVMVCGGPLCRVALWVRRSIVSGVALKDGI